MNLLHVNDRAGEYPPSYYAATATPFAALPALQGEVQADVCIVGGGYTGLSAALHLAQKGYSVVVVEAHRMGFGASGRNGGQVGSGQRQDQDWLEAQVGRIAAHRLWALAEEAKELVKSLIRDHAMPVTFHPGVATACWQEADLRSALQSADRLEREYRYPHLKRLDRTAIGHLVGSKAFKGGVLDTDAGHVHPLNYAFGLARAALSAGAQLFERSEVTAIEPGPRPLVRTATGQVRCGQVILACNGYLGGLDARVAARVMPINNFIVATEPLGDRAAEILAEPVAVADTRFVVNYWRLSEDNRLLFGGGESYGYRFPDILRVVRKPMLQIYPQLADVKIDYAWGGTLAITMNRMPCFVRPAENVLSASGYSGHGVAMATLAGKVLAETVAGHAERFDLLAQIPQMAFPGGPALRWPMLVLAMTWYSLRDRLGL
jgi:gamma-glutamylputrescine oxidase